MTLFQNLCKETRSLVDHNDDTQLLKRIIDLTLDSENLYFYKKTWTLIADLESDNVKDKRQEFTSILDELFAFLEKKEIRERKNLLKIDALVKAYSTRGFVLGPVTLSLNEGEILGLVGENGNGKTTLLRAICGELQSTSGKINYNFDCDNLYDLRSQLIYIPQRTATWKGSLLTNLQFTASSYGIKGEENEYMVDLIVTRMGLRVYRNLEWNRLSSGYKMRFELARMLLRKPKLLLIDEPLANLDILAQQVVLDDFRDIAKSLFRPLGIVLSSQQLYEVEKASDRVLFLHKGSQRNLHEDTVDAEGTKESPKFVIEFESESTYEELINIFSHLGLEKLHLNGGTYVAFFPEHITQDDFLSCVKDHKVSLNYYRNITNSTRRFFLS